MRKEIIVAILVGIIFGGIFTYGIRRANLALKPSVSDMNPNPAPQQQESQVNDTQKILPDSLSILAPEKNDVFTEDTTTITGITKPQSIVVISSESEDFVLKTDDSGEFSQEIELVGGLNEVLINSYSDTNTIGKETLNLVYTKNIDI
jgi:hypothetical protein